jgi:hypothetical protein
MCIASLNGVTSCVLLVLLMLSFVDGGEAADWRLLSGRKNAVVADNAVICVLQVTSGYCNQSALDGWMG